MKNRHKKLWRKETETDKSSCTKKEKWKGECQESMVTRENISIFFKKEKIGRLL